MQTPSTLSIWLLDQARPLALLALLLLLMVAVLSFSAYRRRVQSTAEHPDAGQEAFVDYLTRFGFDAQIARTTYGYLQARQGLGYPVHVGDLLDEDLGLNRSEVQEAIAELARGNGRAVRPGVDLTPVLTVEDLIRLIQASPRGVERAA